MVRSSVIYQLIMKTEILAMILAGGQGSRLGKLTKQIAKPAVPFGGKYRMIDYALSNCANSGISHVGVVTQYQPQILNEHVGFGEPWGLNRHTGGASILQPYSSTEGEKWFDGTAHAVTQNISFIDRYNPEYILILSGDHIYSMNYSKMLDFHKEKQADLTVGVIPVEWDEASRFGIMNTGDDDRIIEFEEKPETPKNNLASMGIYIFNWPTLRKYLVEGEADGNGLTDFGHHIIPAYLKNKEKMFAYSFQGYWRDVGTIESLWTASMEIINPEHELNTKAESWKIYTRNPHTPAIFVADKGQVSDSIVADGAYIAGSVEHSVISHGVQIARNSQIKDSFIMPGVSIGEDAVIENAIIGEKAKVNKGARIIGSPDAVAVLGYEEEIGGQTDEE